MNSLNALPLLIAAVLAPLAQGVINRTKAIVAGRVGQPLIQPYRDMLKLMRKGAVYSETTSWIFQAGPVAGLAAVLCAGALVPLAALPALAEFRGDIVVIAYLLAAGRLFTILAALDTGSSFEGMGASREAAFSALAEPSLFLALAALARRAGTASLTPAIAAVSARTWTQAAPALCLVLGALLIVFLCENSRIPIDDPTTHLELTMIHEVMALDHGGPDLAMIEYAGALKVWVLGAILVGVALPFHSGAVWIDTAIALAGIFALAIAVGLIESLMARLRLLRVPELLIAATILAALALVLVRR
jgi:formate hydrogenlyase subunit 4